MFLGWGPSAEAGIPKAVTFGPWTCPASHMPRGPRPSLHPHGPSPHPKVPAGDPGPIRGPWDQRDSGTAQTPWAFLLPGSPSPSVTAIADTGLWPLSSPTVVRTLSFFISPG